MNDQTADVTNVFIPDENPKNFGRTTIDVLKTVLENTDKTEKDNK